MLIKRWYQIRFQFHKETNAKTRCYRRKKMFHRKFSWLIVIRHHLKILEMGGKVSLSTTMKKIAQLHLAFLKVDQNVSSLTLVLKLKFHHRSHGKYNHQEKWFKVLKQIFVLNAQTWNKQLWLHRLR